MGKHHHRWRARRNCPQHVTPFDLVARPCVIALLFENSKTPSCYTKSFGSRNGPLNPSPDETFLEFFGSLRFANDDKRSFLCHLQKTSELKAVSL